MFQGVSDGTRLLVKHLRKNNAQLIMGQSIPLNMERHGFIEITVYRDVWSGASMFPPSEMHFDQLIVLSLFLFLGLLGRSSPWKSVVGIWPDQRGQVFRNTY